MVEIADMAREARARTGAGAAKAATPLRDVAPSIWDALAAHSVEPNGYYLSPWALAVDAGARRRSHVDALTGFAAARRLIALLPVVSAWRALRLPLPALVSAESYGTLHTPLLSRDDAVSAAQALLDDAIARGARAIVLREVPLAGAAVTAVCQALARNGLRPTVLRRYARACLDATANDSEALLRDALGAKKLKELRRQRNRLGDIGPLDFSVAKTRDEVATAIETFLTLEAEGWKGKRGTALVQHEGDAAFIRRATVELAARGQCEIAVLAAGTTPIAAGVILRHDARAFWFKLGVAEQFAKFSPGVQLALELTRHFCADRSVDFVDSTAPGDSPMINPIWRGRFEIGDLLIPLKPHDPLFAVMLATLRAHRRLDTTARAVLHTVRRWKARLG
jgi:CelD/BcsL family acetyltransferase involved in cellulose biosynthesis